MAVPGFSVSDLIQALGKVKNIYDAFFSEYANSESQIRGLADDIELFGKNLQNHKDIVERAGLEYSGYAAVHRTLDSCERFLDDYKDVLDKRRRKSVIGAYKTARFAFEQEEVDRLRNQIAGHTNNILHYSMNVVLKNSIRSSDRTSSHPIPDPIAIELKHPLSLSPAHTPPFLGSPLLPQNIFLPQPSTSESSSEKPRPSVPTLPNPHIGLLPSPQIIPRSPTHSRSTSRIDSLAQQALPRTSSAGLSIPGLVLPQSALPYRVAEVYFENKKVELKRKAAGRPYSNGNGREMVIVDELGNLRFRHRIKASRGEPCFPYTWHRRWRKDHDALEIGFKGTTPEAHSISFKGAAATSAIPKYVFAETKDFEDFQSELRGKRLEAVFEVRQICSASSSKHGEATDQHLKLWRDHSSPDQEISLSFYASAISKPRHIEIPLHRFDLEVGVHGEAEICLNFVGHGEGKRARSLSKALSRSPTERTTSSASTAIPAIFTRRNTENTSSANSVTTTNSRPSIASSQQSESGALQTETAKTSDFSDTQAKTMKYLRIEFSDDTEALKFKSTYSRLHQEEITRPLDFFLNWQMNAEQQRAESVVSTSPSGTPFTMSPVLRPSRNQPRAED